MDGGHHLPAGVKGCLPDPGHLRLQLRLGQAALGAPCHQRRLGRLAVDIAALGQSGVRAQGHGGGGAVAVAAVIVHHGHFVLGQGAGLIRADDLGTAQRLHGGQAADNGAALGHIGDADAQHHCHHGSKALGDGGHRQRHSDHEGVKRHVQRKLTGPQQLHAENQHADHQHQLGQHAGQLGQLPLQGRLALLGVGQRVGDLAHLRIHAGLGDHHAAAAIDHGGAHVDHVLPVAQGHILRVILQIQDVNEFGHRHRLAGKGGLLHLHAGALQHAAVRRNGVAGLQQHHIAHHQFLAADGDGLAVPQHLTGGGSHLLQGLDGLFRLALLIHAQHGVDDDHKQNNDYVGKALVLHHCQNGADGSGHQQDNDHRVRHLLEKPFDQGILLGFRQLVSAVFGKADFRLIGG